MMRTRIILWAVVSLFVLIGPATVFAQTKTIILATTTSTQDSGLLDVLIPIFEKNTGYFVKTIAVGSGQAMAMGQKGEADVLLVHSPAAEKKFVAEGYGIHRRLIMHNDFIIVGPPGDPAKIKGIKAAS
jgi:tungstate transport system substrate-binding protein